jgi:hypothetical protein
MALYVPSPFVLAPLTRVLSVVRNFKPTYSIFRELSREARSAPVTFTSRDAKPKLLCARVVRHPISPLARIWSALIRNTAAADTVLHEAENDRVHVEFNDVYTGDDLQVIMDSYAEIPAGIRSLLLGRVMHRVMTQAAIWTKRESPRSACGNAVSRYLTIPYSEGTQRDCLKCPSSLDFAPRNWGTTRGLSSPRPGLNNNSLYSYPSPRLMRNSQILRRIRLRRSRVTSTRVLPISIRSLSMISHLCSRNMSPPLALTSRYFYSS